MSVGLLLAGVAGVGAVSWGIVVPYRLAAARSARVYLVPAVLLALAAFVPVAVAIWDGGRAELGLSDPQISRILIAAYLFGACTTALYAQRVPWRPQRRIFVLVLGYWLVTAVSNYYAGLPVGRLSFWAIPLIFLVAWQYRVRYGDSLRLLALVSLAVCGASLLLAYVEPSAAFFDEARVARFLSTERLAGVTEHPNALGLLAALGVVLWWYWKPWLGLPICGVALIASDSRTAWLACAAAFIVIFVAGRHRERPFSPAQLVFGGVLLVAVAWFLVTYAAPEQQQELTFTGRVEVWEFVGSHWDQSPVIGHGPGVWQELISGGQLPIWAGQAHNQLLQTLYTTGLVGVVLLLALAWCWTANNLRFARDGFPLPLALEAALVVYALFESPFTHVGVSSNIWLLALVLFLRPALGDDPQPLRSPVRRLTGESRAHG